MKRNYLVNSIAALVLVGLLTGCAGFYRGSLTLTAAVDSASREYARMYNDGLIPAETHLKVSNAHAEYRKAAGIAHDALSAYQLSGDPASYREAFTAAQKAGLAFVQMLVPYLTQSKSDSLVAAVTKANEL